MIRRRVGRAAAVAAGVLAMAATGCADAEQPQRQPEAADDGLQATGRIDGQRVAISSGDPQVVLGDCDANDGLDRDLCLLARTIDGLELNVVLENPDVLTEGAPTPVRDDPCDGPACDDVAEHAVVDVRVGGEQVRATGGRIVPSATGERYIADFDLRLPGSDRLVGGFNVRPGAR